MAFIFPHKVYLAKGVAHMLNGKVTLILITSGSCIRQILLCQHKTAHTQSLLCDCDRSNTIYPTSLHHLHEDAEGGTADVVHGDFSSVVI